MTDSIASRIFKRWSEGIDHEPEAEQIARALAHYLPDHDIKFGGDGDIGEEFMYALSLWIEDGKPDLAR